MTATPFMEKALRLSLCLILAFSLASCKKADIPAPKAAEEIDSFVMNGTLTDTQNTPIADAQLTLVTPDLHMNGTSDKQGLFSFKLDNATPQWLTLKVSHPSLQIASCDEGGKLLQDQTDTLIWNIASDSRGMKCHIVMQKTVQLTGKVLRTNGKAASNAKAMYVVFDRNNEWDTTFADADGNFTFGLPPSVSTADSNATLLFWDADAREAAAFPFDHIPEEAGTPQTIVLTEETPLSGTLMASDGNVMPDTALSFFYCVPNHTIGLDTTTTLTDKHGNFAFTAAPNMEIGIRLRNERNKSVVSTRLPVNDWTGRPMTLIYQKTTDELLINFDTPQENLTSKKIAR